MPKYKFVGNCDIEVWSDYNDEADHGEKSIERFKAGEIVDFDIIAENDEGTHVDIQFGDGDVALTIDRTWFEEIKVKDNYPVEKGRCRCGGPFDGYEGPVRFRPGDLIHRGGNNYQCPRCFGMWKPQYNYTELQMDDMADLAKVHGDKLDLIAEAHDHAGTLQGWVSQRPDELIDLVFEHSIVTINYQFQAVADRLIYRIDEQD